jgi:hypothetical protein
MLLKKWNKPSRIHPAGSINPMNCLLMFNGLNNPLFNEGAHAPPCPTWSTDVVDLSSLWLNVMEVDLGWLFHNSEGTASGMYRLQCIFHHVHQQNASSEVIVSFQHPFLELNSASSSNTTGKMVRS